MSDKENVPRDDIVYAVHAVRSQEITATELICRTQSEAESYAASLSTNPAVIAAAVSRFRLDQLGTRSPVALFVAGERQDVPYVSNDRRVFANAHGPASRYGRTEADGRHRPPAPPA
jgi:hypothetical protein